MSPVDVHRLLWGPRHLSGSAGLQRHPFFRGYKCERGLCKKKTGVGGVKRWVRVVKYVHCAAGSTLAKEAIHHYRVGLHVELHLPSFHTLKCVGVGRLHALRSPLQKYMARCRGGGGKRARYTPPRTSEAKKVSLLATGPKKLLLFTRTSRGV